MTLTRLVVGLVGSETADLLGSTHTTIPRVYWKWPQCDRGDFADWQIHPALCQLSRLLVLWGNGRGEIFSWPTAYLSIAVDRLHPFVVDHLSRDFAP